MQHFCNALFTRSTESHACKGMPACRSGRDEWLSAQGSAPQEQEPEMEEAPAIKPWSFTSRRKYKADLPKPDKLLSVKIQGSFNCEWSSLDLARDDPELVEGSFR